MSSSMKDQIILKVHLINFTGILTQTNKDAYSIDIFATDTLKAVREIDKNIDT